MGNKCDRGGRRKVGVQEAKDWAERLFLKSTIWNMAERFPNFFLKTTQFSFSPCSIHLGRYNMIFVETSAKDNTGVEQVSFDSTAESDPNSPFLCNQHTFTSGLQAFLELVDRVLQSPGIWSPGQGLATAAPSQARPPILGYEQISERPFWGRRKHLNAPKITMVSFSRPQQRRTSSPPPCCGT